MDINQEKLQQHFGNFAKMLAQASKSREFWYGAAGSLAAGMLIQATYNSFDGQIEGEVPEGAPCAMYEDFANDMNSRIVRKGYSGTVTVDLMDKNGNPEQCFIVHGSARAPG